MNSNNACAIDFRTLPDFIPSMCIPRVYPNISEGRIRKIFDELNKKISECKVPLSFEPIKVRVKLDADAMSCIIASNVTGKNG
jgi:hypothetical protein